MFQVLGTLAAGELRFYNIQQEFHALKREHDEALKKATKYQEDLKEADDRVKHREVSIFQAERERQHTQALLDKACHDLMNAQVTACELNLTRSAVIQAQTDVEGEQDQLKV